MQKAIIYYDVTYVIRLYIYPRSSTDTVRITGSFTKFLEYDQALVFSISRCGVMERVFWIGLAAKFPTHQLEIDVVMMS